MSCPRRTGTLHWASWRCTAEVSHVPCRHPENSVFWLDVSYRRTQVPISSGFWSPTKPQTFRQDSSSLASRRQEPAISALATPYRRAMPCPRLLGKTLTDGSLNFAQNLVIRNGPSTFIVCDDLRLFIDFLKKRCTLAILAQ